MPRDRGAWWAAVYGVAQSRTRLKQLSSSSTLCKGASRWLSHKESACNAGDTGDVGLVHAGERSPGGENGNPLQYSCLENPMDRGDWRARVRGVTKK